MPMRFLATVLLTIQLAMGNPTSAAQEVMQEPGAFLIVAGPPNTSTAFVRLDAAGRHLDERPTRFGTSEQIAIRRRAGLSLSLREVEPGDYALASVASSTFTGTTWFCATTDVPVYTIEPGQIVIVPTAWLWNSRTYLVAHEASDADILGLFEGWRTRHRDVEGTPVVQRQPRRSEWPNGPPSCPLH